MEERRLAGASVVRWGGPVPLTLGSSKVSSHWGTFSCFCCCSGQLALRVGENLRVGTKNCWVKGTEVKMVIGDGYIP